MAEPPSSSPLHNTTTATTTTITTPTGTSWGTLEELLLAFAVHRYGTNAWDSIATELQNRTSFSLLTPNICQQKYRDLKRRFASDERNAADDASLWLDELRRLRVAELRRDLQRYDLSIVSLQLKVKKLKEETSNGVKEEREEDSDLQTNDEKEAGINEVKIEPPDETEPEPVEPEENEPALVDEPAGDDSCNGSSNSKEERGGEERRERVDSAELVESVAESKDEGGGGGDEGVKESSDVQSTASLWRSENDNNGDKNNIKNKRENKAGVFSGTSSGEENQSSALKSTNDGKSQPLVEFLDVVRGRKLGSCFERRLESQETPKYTSLIKQHIDLETIQRRLEEGQYTDCQTKFYRDLTLLINNAIVFFTKRSSEHKAALELRQLLNKQFQSHLSSPHDHKSHPSEPTQPAPLPEPAIPEAKQDDKLPKLTITGPIIASRKRSSIAGKSSRGGGERKEPALVTPPDEKAPLGEMVKQQREKTSSFNAVTKKRTRDQSLGSRSSSSKNINNNPSPSTPISSKGESSEAKADKKKPSPGNSSNKIKQGSGSGKNLLLESLKNSGKRKTSNGSNSGYVKSDRRKDEGPQNGSSSTHGKEKAKGKEERESSRNRNTRRPPKRAAAIAAVGKRGRDGGKEAESPAKKRQRK